MAGSWPGSGLTVKTVRACDRASMNWLLRMEAIRPDSGHWNTGLRLCKEGKKELAEFRVCSFDTPA